MLAVSHTKPLHDAVAQMADDLYGGYAPATPFLNNQEVYRQSVQPERAVLFYPAQSELHLSTSDGTYRKNVTASCTEYLFYINYKAL